MGEVAIHLHHIAGALVQRMAKAGQIGGADARSSRSVQHLHPLVLARQRVGQLACAVGRAVIDDSTRKPSGAASAEHPPAAATIALMFSASLYVGSISQGSPDIGRRTLEQWPYPVPEQRSPTPRSPPRWTSWATSTSWTARSSTACWPTERRRVRSARHPTSVAQLARAGRATELPGIGRRCRRRSSRSLDTGTIPARRGCARSSRRA